MSSYEPLDLLAVFAHPDDAELLCGGSLARSADAGERVGILDLSRGEMASRGTVEARERESARAARIMGVAVRENAEFPDGAIEDSVEARRILAGWFRELRPRVVVTHWIESRHPDHRATAALVYAAGFLSGLKNLDAPGRPHRPEKIVHAIGFREDAPRPTFVIDITEQMDRKLEAVAAFESQFAGNRAAGEVLPGGERPLLEQIRVQCGHYGSLIRAEYGEPFWTRETMEASSLGSVGVSSY